MRRWCRGNMILVLCTLAVLLPELAVAGSITGVVMDAITAEPIQGVQVTYWSDRDEYWTGDTTDVNGVFSLIALPAGPAEIKARPDVETGYAWNLPWLINQVCLDENEDRTDQIIALQKGALVTGYIKDSSGQPMPDLEFEWSGKMSDGWMSTDANGFYEIRFPVGSYNITIDEDAGDFGVIAPIINIADIDQPIDVNDMVLYSEQTGGSLSGVVNNSGGYAKTGFFGIVAFTAGTVIDSNTWYTIAPVRETGLAEAGDFDFIALPPDPNYDIFLLVMNEDEDGIQSISARDSQLDVSVGSSGLNLSYTSQGGIVTGSIENVDGNPVIGAVVMLNDSDTGEFSAFTNADENGDFIIYNVSPGEYNIAVSHSKYQDTSATSTVQVADGATVEVSAVVIPFSGEKEAVNLNGDGLVNFLDFAELADKWGEDGSFNADFNQNQTVGLEDLQRLIKSWLYRPIWYNN